MLAGLAKDWSLSGDSTSIIMPKIHLANYCYAGKADGQARICLADVLKDNAGFVKCIMQAAAESGLSHLSVRPTTLA